MATANTYLQVTELDFEQIRTNLKSYLSTQDQFRDYNFEGSAMATLLDVLAYNTHYNAYYLNMLANEMFLDTAQQRDSVVSRAKELGYTPSSAVGATANVEITFTGVANTITQFTIAKNSKFSTTVDDVRYTYVTPEAYTVVRNNDLYVRSIDIKEGKLLTHRWTVSSVNPERYILPNQNIDISSIIVRVQESVADTTTTEYTRATNVREIRPTSLVYFLEEADNGKYEIVFSPGTLGRPVRNGNIVIVDYLVCNGSDTNGAATFSIDDLNVGGTSYSTATVTTNNSAAGGRSSESIESIKFNAPKSYQTQNRAIVDNDYQRILIAENSDLQSVIAFGGDQADPPVYGKVYIGVKPFAEKYATNNRKEQLRVSILNRVPLSIDPVMIDPTYTYILPTVTTYYSTSSSTATRAEIEAAIRGAIASFSTNNLERFGNRLRYSRFVRALDNISTGTILNNDVTIQMQKRFTPNLNSIQRIQLNFNNQIQENSLSSSQFTSGGFISYFDDDGAGNVRSFRYDAQRNKVILNATAGTIDYTNGIVVLQSFNPTSFVDLEMKMTATPRNLDIIPVREQILIMEEQDSTITVIGEIE